MSTNDPRPTLIAPSILSADFARLAEEIVAIEQAGADWVHLDIMDGHFVPNISYGPAVVKAMRPHTKMPFDVHLMITDPDDFLQEFIDAGADIITVHAETCTHLHRTLSTIKQAGIKAGVSLNPHTQPDFLVSVADLVDMVLVMTVNPGFSGQKFIHSVLPKIGHVLDIFADADKEVLVQIDGGINPETAVLAREAGANVLVAGNAVFSKPADEYASIIATLKG